MSSLLRSATCTAGCLCVLLLGVGTSNAESNHKNWIGDFSSEIYTSINRSEARSLWPSNDDDSTLVPPTGSSRDIFDPLVTGSIGSPRSDSAFDFPADDDASTLVPAWR